MVLRTATVCCKRSLKPDPVLACERIVGIRLRLRKGKAKIKIATAAFRTLPPTFIFTGVE